MKVRAIARRSWAAVAAGALAIGLVACTSDTEDTTSTTAAGESESVVMYSGRNEELIDPLLPTLEELSGVSIDVRYGSTPELAAQLAEEGDASPADLFLSQDAGALGALQKNGLLSELDSETVSNVDSQYRAADDSWVATSLRARVIQYNSEAVQEADVPTTIDALLDPKWRGKIGYAPGNASFQSFVTALRIDRGEEAAEQWLRDFVANEPVTYEKNDALLDAVDAGEVELGLSNHYYWYNKAKEVGEDNLTAKVAYLESGDPGALVNVAGVGILNSSENKEPAAKVVDALLSVESQQYFLDETSEYPVIDGITSDSAKLPPIESLNGPDIDLSDLDSLEETQALLQKVGMI